MNKEEFSAWLLKIGLVSTFTYSAISGFVNPTSWIGFMPQFLRSIFSDAIILSLFGAYELALSVWLLSGKRLFYSSILAATTFAGIILFNLPSMEIVFRDFGLFLAALALAELARDMGED